MRAFEEVWRWRSSVFPPWEASRWAYFLVPMSGRWTSLAFARCRLCSTKTNDDFLVRTTTDLDAESVAWRKKRFLKDYHGHRSGQLTHDRYFPRQRRGMDSGNVGAWLRRCPYEVELFLLGIEAERWPRTTDWRQNKQDLLIRKPCKSERWSRVRQNAKRSSNSKSKPRIWLRFEEIDIHKESPRIRNESKRIVHSAKRPRLGSESHRDGSVWAKSCSNNKMLLEELPNIGGVPQVRDVWLVVGVNGAVNPDWFNWLPD